MRVCEYCVNVIFERKTMYKRKTIQWLSQIKAINNNNNNNNNNKSSSLSLANS